MVMLEVRMTGSAYPISHNNMRQALERIGGDRDRG